MKKITCNVTLMKIRKIAIVPTNILLTSCTTSPFLASLNCWPGTSVRVDVTSCLHYIFHLKGFVHLFLSLQSTQPKLSRHLRTLVTAWATLPSPFHWRHCTYLCHAVHNAVIECLLSYSCFKPGLYFKCFTNKNIITQHVHLFLQYPSKT